ncbi:MAG: hypothetical protein KKH98_01290, partial [Spirochaetes bacterium]|nr:hypothetical protein [Spirochaetota bacterium]
FPPVWISADSISANQIDLHWEDQLNETSCTLFRNLVNNSNTATNIAFLGANITNYSDMNCQPATMYYYWLKAYNTYGASKFSVTISNLTRPAAIQWIYARALSTNQTELLWRDVQNETSYTLYRNTEINTNTAIIVTGVGANITNSFDTNLISDVTYYYWLKAYALSGDSAFSAPISIKVGNNIISSILFPENNSFIDAVSFFKGGVVSPVTLQDEETLLQRMSDQKYFSGTEWQDNEIWLNCTGTTNWLYSLTTDKIFDYGFQYTIKARGRDIYGLTESKYPSVLFTFVYSTDFKHSLCNYPNPFYPDSQHASDNKTTIEYFLSENRDVKIYIYAINGELVKKWAGAEYGQMGLHRVLWDGKNENGMLVASSVYMLVVTADNEKQIEKILVVR